MPLVSLSSLMQTALTNNYAVAGVVVLGWEDARAYVRAAEAENLPVILQAGPGCRAHTPLPILGKMFTHLAENSSVPVVAHLDHSYSLEDCRQAIECGFTSVMFDGSKNDLQENIDLTSEVVDLAQRHGVSVEGEIGFVGYDSGEVSSFTKPWEAREFARQTRVDAMAVSVGNVHLQQTKAAKISLEAIRAIEAKTSLPLVLHGGSGIPAETRKFLAHTTNVCKFNIGTELRMAFGQALRGTLDKNPERFDRISILKETEAPLEVVTRELLRNLAS